MIPKPDCPFCAGTGESAVMTADAARNYTVPCRCWRRETITGRFVWDRPVWHIPVGRQVRVVRVEVPAR